MNENRTRERRVGLVGAGFIADWHASALKRVPNAKLIAVCDLARARAEALAAEHGAEQVYTELEDMLASARLDVVHILTPPQVHTGPIKACLEAGAHVLTEKPMCTDLGEAESLADLAETKDLSLGVAHNFLYMPGYEKLREDVRTGVLGKVERIEVVWAKELGFPMNGPFDVWMLRDPGNIAWETGPHPLSFVVDLLGEPELESIEPFDPMTLPTGITFFRRFNIRYRRDGTQCDVYLSFVVGGFHEHEVRARGAMGRARVDLERNVYVREQHGGLPIDLDSLALGVRSAVDVARQSSENFGFYALNKTKLARVGKNPFDQSITGLIQSFYNALGGPLDERVSPARAISVLKLADRVAKTARAVAGPQPTLLPTPRRPTKNAKVLVLGGTGFIGRELVRQLIGRGETVRVVGRSAAPGLWGDVDESKLDLVKDSMSNPEVLAASFEGIEKVYHLARAEAKTWDEWVTRDIEPTRRIAELCLDKGVKRLVYTSTVHCYFTGNPKETITRDTPLDPKMDQRTYYSKAKAQCEAMLLEMHRERGLDVVITRPGVVLGTGGPLDHFGFGYWSYGRVCEFWGQGDNPVPTVLVEDVATGLVLAMETPGVAGKSFNFAGDVMISAREYVEELERYSGLKIDARPTSIATFFAGDVAKWLVKVAVRHPTRVRVPSYRDWLSNAHLAKYDCTETKRELGWTPESDRQRFIERAIHVVVDEQALLARPEPREPEVGAMPGSRAPEAELPVA